MGTKIVTAHTLASGPYRTDLVTPELHIQNPGPYKSGLRHRWYLTTHTGHWTLQKWSNEVDSTSLHTLDSEPKRNDL